jgi:hypothetical protein
MYEVLGIRAFDIRMQEQTTMLSLCTRSSLQEVLTLAKFIEMKMRRLQRCP